MPDAIVVGAGIGGLAAAICLGASGLEVTLLESAPRPGGKAATVVVDGVEVDTGPSVLTLPDVFEDIFERSGARLRDELTLLEPSPAFRYFYPDGVTLDVHVRTEATLDSVGRALGTDARGELERFLRYAERIWSAAAPEFVYGEAPNLRSVLGGGLRAWARLSKIDPLSSMWGSIRKRVRSPHLRMLLARYATYNGSDVRRAPATLNCISHVELALGGFGVAGGMYELVRAMVRAAQRVGVRIVCGVRVERILVEKRAVRGVELDDGQVVRAPRVIANADVAHVATDLLGDDAAHGLEATAQPSMSGHNMIVAARTHDDRRGAQRALSCGLPPRVRGHLRSRPTSARAHRISLRAACGSWARRLAGA